MKSNKLVESLNLEKGKDAVYYVNWLKERGIEPNDYKNITVMAVRCHLAKYGEITSTILIELMKKYNLNKGTSTDIQQQLVSIYFSELEKALQEVA